MKTQGSWFKKRKKKMGMKDGGPDLSKGMRQIQNIGCININNNGFLLVIENKLNNGGG